MPTGYTSCLTEGRPVTFQEFAWRCARAFMPFVNQRDESIDSTPVLIAQPSTYHIDALKKAKAELADFMAKSPQAKYGWAKRQRNKSVQNYLQYQGEKDAQKQAYENMLVQVQAWNPPTPDHQRMKEFMVEQLTESIRFDCGTYYSEQVARLKATPLKTLVDEHIESLRHSVEYHTKEQIEEMDRINGSNTWKVALVKSLGLPPKI